MDGSAVWCAVSMVHQHVHVHVDRVCAKNKKTLVFNTCMYMCMYMYMYM